MQDEKLPKIIETVSEIDFTPASSAVLKNVRHFNYFPVGVSD